MPGIATVYPDGTPGSPVMWLLRTNTAELRYFNSPHDVKSYAILSHVWQEHEQSFQDLQALHTQLASTGQADILRSHVSDKIRECCALAESHGYEWLWIDTCCIDRSSSAELSEAINSMYEWYAQAQVCYAYLHDVPRIDDFHARDLAIRHSKWFTRGWTLQELIAPRSLLFVAQDWTMIGTKASLASLLEGITGVDADVLTFRRELGDVSVARRMWWASARKTTRIEDEAYCLMGIFGVHIATIYGEGRRAFQRLQEEILRRTSDQTLFAWGNVLPIRTVPFQEQMVYSDDHNYSYMFAPSPEAFAASGKMIPVPMNVAVENTVNVLGITHRALESSQDATQPKAAHPDHSHTWNIPLPDFTVTSHGVRAHLLVIESPAKLDQSTLAIVLLACQDTATGAFVGLLLRHRVDDEIGLRWPRYHVGVTLRLHPGTRTRFRLGRVDWARHALSFKSSGITARWQRLYIAFRPPSRAPLLEKARTDAAFKLLFPRWMEVELEKEGFRRDTRLSTACGEAERIGQGALATFTFRHERLPEAFRIYVGLCKKTPWATAAFLGDTLLSKR
ncbi:HET-domain-containing protein [Trametes versicolor FP-101664 SS1]|uniref:HET-domain-containing protein n=1 Tax=Trametes versicolor (strain FP-101664) TaxID=717944 RepID=UPI0004623B61|nr:HET-domain-containing protein [Trametes versicolor FP-101664 SS1]EIW59843.1 HET-domain-containing protein [Trametes versicolor FP-101664 SS1]